MKFIKATLSIACMTLSATTFASTADIKASNNQIGIHYISTNVDYKETGNGIFGTPTGTLNTETGSVPGKALSISTMWGPENGYFEAQYSRNNGNTNYTGALIGGGPFGSVMSTSSATITDYSLRFGKGFAVDDPSTAAYDVLMLTPYVELGHHIWDRGVNLGETYTHSYLGIGALGQLSPVNSKLVITLNALIGQTFGSNIVINGPFGFSGTLGNSTLYKAGLSFDYAFTKHFHGNFGSEYASFAYGMSGVHSIGGGFVAWEPDSTTTYTTFKVGLGYAF